MFTIRDLHFTVTSFTIIANIIGQVAVLQLLVQNLLAICVGQIMNQIKLEGRCMWVYTLYAGFVCGMI